MRLQHLSDVLGEHPENLIMRLFVWEFLLVQGKVASQSRATTSINTAMSTTDQRTQNQGG